jgi:replicative DNA helicase
MLDVSLDRPQPQSPEAERAVLGAILENSQAYWRIADILVVEDFFKDPHRLIYKAICDLAQKSVEIDLLTVKHELARNNLLSGAGGSAYVSSLTDVVPDVANVERYARIVKEKSTLRQLILAGNRLMRTAFDAPEDPSEVLAFGERELARIAEGHTERNFVTLDRITRTNLTALDNLQQTGRLITGVPTGYDRFNEFTSGFQPQDLIIIAARPSQGKTAFMMNIAEAIAVPDNAGQPRGACDRLYTVGVFSLEMSKEQIGLRLLSAEANISSHLIRSGMLSERNWKDLAAASVRLSKAPIAIDDTPGIDPLELRAKARRLKNERGLDILMVDYLQLMSVKGKVESRQQEVSIISRSLKATAKELNVPLVSLSQLSRRPEQRTGDHRPQLSDLRESGSIEQDADVVCFIYRDEVYNPDTEEKGIAEIIIGKQRNGPIGDFKLVFRNDITRFFNYEPQPDYMPV